ITVVTTAPNAPNATPASNFTCTSLNANWAASAGATAYFLDVSTDVGFGSFVAGFNNLNVNNVTTYNITGLTVNTTYYYRVRAGNGCSTSANSNSITVVTTAPNAPNATPASNFTCTSLNANWAASAGATAYFLDVSTDAAFGSFVAGFNNLNVNNVTTYNITGLTVNTTYYYRVRAGNGCSTSANSNSITVVTTAPNAPNATPASNFTCTSLNANWAASAGATAYFLDVSTDAAFGSFVTGFNNLNVNNVTTYNITGLTVNTTYYYRVRAGNGCSTSANSNSITVVTTAPNAPNATPASNFTCTSLNANWAASAGATAYFLDVSTDAGFGSFVAGFNNLNVNNVTTYNITGLTVNTTYYYRVRAGNGCSTSANSNSITVVTTAPNAPNATPASNFTCTSLNANWAASAGATAYFLDVSTDAGFGSFVAGFNNLNVNNVTTYNITGLTVNTTYYYRVRAGNGCSTSANSNSITVVTTAPNAPNATPASNFTCTSLNANWAASAGATAYFLDVSTDAAFGSFVAGFNNLNVNNVTTYNITGLTANTTYYYRVRSGNGCSNSANSNTITVVTTAPNAPNATAASNFTCTSFNANWTVSAGATGYFLDVSTNSAFTGIVSGFNNLSVNNVTTYNVTGLSSNTAYYYRVRANNGCSTSANSNTITVITTSPNAPNATAASNFTCTSLNANWSVSAGATGYFLDVATDASFTGFVSGFNNLSVNNVTTYNVTGLSSNTTYYYRVRSSNGCNVSGNSNTITVVTTSPNAPNATAASNFTCTSVNANWAASAGATGYFLDVSTDASFATFVGAYSNLSVGLVTTYNVTGLTSNATYYYRVRASNGCSASSNSNTVTVFTTAPNAPAAAAASNFTCTSFNANWSVASGATGYFIDVSTSAAFASFVTGYNNLSLGLVTTYNITGLTSNTTYYYRLRASNGCNTSGNSNTITVITTSPNAPNATAASNFTCTSFNANWSAASGATVYFLDVATDASFTGFVSGFNNLSVNNVTTYNVTGLTSNTTYYYRLRAGNGCSTSANSNTITVFTTAPNAPAASAASNFTCTSFNANWAAVSGATNYFMDVSTEANFSSFVSGYSNLSVGLVTTYNITGLTSNTTYYYRIRSGNGCSTSPNSNTIIVFTTAPNAPNAAAASNFTCTSFNANWGASVGATEYFLDVSTSAAFTDFVSGYNGLNVALVTTYNVTGLSTNTSYYYRTRAANGCDTSDNSNTVTVITTAPSAPNAVAASNFTCTSLNANWSASVGATNYYIDVSTDAAFGSFVGVFNNLNVGSVTTKNITGLSSGSTYYYRVRAANGCSTSPNSNTITEIIDEPNAPAAVAASNFTCTSFNANWGASAGGPTNYLLDVSTSAGFANFVTGFNSKNVGLVTTYNVTGLTSGVTYFYRVRAVNGCSTSANSNTITEIMNGPNAPNAVAASNLSCTSFNANWSAAAGSPTNYLLDVSTSSTFASFITGFNAKNVGLVTTYNVTGLSSGVIYYYRVRAVNGCGASANSNTIAETTDEPNAPAATAASNFTCTSFNANWGASAGGPTNYLLDVSTSSTFTSFVSGYNSLNVGLVTTYNVSGLSSGIIYYYRVRAVNACATSPNSNTIAETTNEPNAPAASAASNFTCTSFNANWGASAGSPTHYLLDVSTSSSFANFVTGFSSKNVGLVTTYNVTGLTSGSTYYYRVRAVNACATSANSNTIAETTDEPNAPAATAASNFTCTSFNANWGVSAGGPTHYLLDVSTSSRFANFVTGFSSKNVGLVTTYNVTGLSSGVTYYYRVRAANACATSANSNTIVEATDEPNAPAATAASNFTCTSFNANWGASAGGPTHYLLDVSTSSSFASFVTGFSSKNVGLVTTYNVTGLSSGVTYYYRVRAVNACATSANSNTIVETTNEPNAPAASAASNFTCTSFNANWGGSAGAPTHYLLDVSTDVTFGSFVTGFSSKNVGLVTTYNITGLSSGVTYYYRVRAANACATSANSNTIVEATDEPNAPAAAAASNFTCTSFNANWGASAGAPTHYLLDVSTSSSFANFVTGFSSKNVGLVTTYNVTGLTSGSTYYYRVRAANACATSGYSNIAVSIMAAPLTPVASAASNLTCTSFNANWGAASGATGYLLDVSTSAIFGSFVTGYNNLDVGAVTTYNVTGLTAGVNYYYRVRSSNGCSASVSSNYITVSTVLPDQPVANAVTNYTCTSFTATWAAAAGATSYSLDVSTTPAFSSFVTGYNNLNVGLVTTRNVTGLTANTTYYFRVRANNNCGTSASSSSIMFKVTSPAPPVASVPVISGCTSFNAQWSVSTGATNYFLDVSTSAAFTSFVTGYNALNVGDETDYAISGLTSGMSYYYRVSASNSCGTSGYSSIISAVMSAPDPPVTLNIAVTTIACSSFEAKWTASSGAVNYYLDVSTVSNFASFVSGYNNLDVGLVTAVNVSGLTTNTTYYYRVRAANVCGTSTSSGVVTTTTGAPTIPTAGAATSLTSISFRANWTLVSNALVYYVDVATDAGFTNFVPGYNNRNVGNTDLLTVTGLSSATTYYYRVRAANSCGVSGHSGTITVTTP
ncbi:MAG: fibronectin type III domain-containing protein, partial [Bacteroidia bacterium]